MRGESIMETTPEQSEVIRCAGNWFDGRDGSTQELRNAVLALRVAGAVAAVKAAREGTNAQ